MAMEIEGVPQEGFVGETKDKETARRGGAVVESGSNGGEFRGRHVVGCGVDSCNGSIVEERGGDGGRYGGGGGK